MFLRKRKPEIGLEQADDYTYKGVPIGKWTYFGEGVMGALDNGYIAQIGRFTSINGEAQIHVNHQSNMIFQSDELVHVFSNAQKAAYKAKMLQDPKLPGTPNKSHKLEIGADVRSIVITDLAVLVSGSLLSLYFVYSGRRLARAEGAMMLAVYLGYMAYVII